MTTWLDPPPGFRALGLAVLISAGAWDDADELLTGIAEREGILAALELDAQALALLEQRDRDLELDDDYAALTAQRP